MWNLLHLRGRAPSVLMAVALLVAASRAGAQVTTPATGGASSAVVEVLCRLEVPALCSVRDVQQVSVRHLGDGLHEVSFDVVVGSNTRWTLTVKPRPSTSGAAVPAIEVRDEAGEWVSVNPERAPVTIISAHASVNQHAERVVFRLRAPNHLAALQLVQFEVLPTTPR